MYVYNASRIKSYHDPSKKRKPLHTSRAIWCEDDEKLLPWRSRPQNCILTNRVRVLGVFNQYFKSFFYISTDILCCSQCWMSLLLQMIWLSSWLSSRPLLWQRVRPGSLGMRIHIKFCTPFVCKNFLVHSFHSLQLLLAFCFECLCCFVRLYGAFQHPPLLYVSWIDASVIRHGFHDFLHESSTIVRNDGGQ